MVIQWKILSPFREVSGMSIANIFYHQIFHYIDFFLLNLFWYFWDPQEALNKGIGQHITEVRAKTLKKLVSFIFGYVSLISYKKTYHLDLCLWFILFWESESLVSLLSNFKHLHTYNA